VVKNINIVTENRINVDRIELKRIVADLNEKYSSIIEVLNLEKTKNKIKELEEATNDASFWLNQDKAKTVISSLNDLKDKVLSTETLKRELDNLNFILDYIAEDESLIEEANNSKKKFDEVYESISLKLLLNEEADKLDCILEIHSGAGGTESLDWANMLFRMYQMYAQKNKFKITILDYQEGEEVGIKSVSMKLEGTYAYGYLKSESGVHRLIRLSPFDSDHARHTTFASVLVTPLITDDINIEINENDLRIDVFHSSGAGGQGVNTTDSAVRVTHLPTKIVVTCQNERSQIQNKESAIKVLKSRLYKIELDKRREELDKLNNKSQISFGSQIRTYTFHPYTLVKDHRTGYETSQGDKVMNGELDEFINSYLKFKGKN